jgi:glucose uptake protein GlcU
MPEIILSSIAVLFSILALVFSALLSKESKGEKYWVFFTIAAIGFFASSIARNEFFSNSISMETISLIQEIGMIIGSFSFAYAAFGLYRSMKKIREKIGQELNEA